MSTPELTGAHFHTMIPPYTLAELRQGNSENRPWRNRPPRHHFQGSQQTSPQGALTGCDMV